MKRAGESGCRKHKGKTVRTSEGSVTRLVKSHHCRRHQRSALENRGTRRRNVVPTYRQKRRRGLICEPLLLTTTFEGLLRGASCWRQEGAFGADGTTVVGVNPRPVSVFELLISLRGAMSLRGKGRKRLWGKTTCFDRTPATCTSSRTRGGASSFVRSNANGGNGKSETEGSRLKT